MLDRIAEFFIFGFAPLVAGMLAAPEIPVAGDRVLKGEVTYRERVALPPDAVLTVELAEVSRGGSPAVVVARREIEPAGQPPIPFDLAFDRALVRPDAAYALLARVTAGEKLLFTNDEGKRVDPLTDAPVMLLVKMPAQVG